MSPTSDDEVRVADNAADRRYEARIGERLVGISEYDLDAGAGVITFVHTEVAPNVEGQGIGGKLAAGALEDVRARGLKVSAECPFIGAYLRRHAKDFADIVATAKPDAT